MYRHLSRKCSTSTSYTRSLGSTRNYAQPTPVLRRDKINYNVSPFVLQDDNAHLKYKRVTAEDLVTHKKPPKRVKMLVRDFIHDSLYNPNYGYFPNNAVIFSPDKSFDFGSLNDEAHFQDAVAKRYAEYGAVNLAGEGPGRQIWHTPTELFKVSY